ncbi:translocation/assembly module TamB [Winogradskyella sp. E313]|uniref:Translocation/assembly module TamB n=2 Tax=Winogradskyella immobilis TaxID=2816852 RepID=A0ABS8ELU7_9FLAO|nr:translocation/assembly module TamB [Winogradskyella immobilis]
MSFNQLQIETEASVLKGDLQFKYDRKDLAKFTDKVQIVASFKDSEVEMSELNLFYNEFGRNQRAKFNADFSGTLNDLTANNLNISTSRNTRIRGNINFKNIFNGKDKAFVLDGRYSNLSSNYNDLVTLMPNVLGRSIPSIFSKVGNFKITGNSTITTTDINTDLDITTDIGFAKSRLTITDIDDIDKADYIGNLILEDFNIGELLNDPLVKNTSLNLDVDGKSFDLENIETNVKGDITYLEYNNYKYTKINVSGDIGKNIFNGLLQSNDPNLILDFNGLADMSSAIRKFDFKADVDYVNLRALNFVTRDTISEFSGLVEMTVNGSTLDNTYGKINVKKTTYKNQDNSYGFDDFSIVSSFKNNERTITIDSPDIIEGEVVGQFKIRDVFKLVENSIGSIYANYSPYKLDAGQYLDFKFNIYNQIATIFYKDLQLGPNTVVDGRIESDANRFDLKFNSPKISFKDYYADNIKIEVDNSNPVYNTYMELDKIDAGFYKVSDFSLINVTKRDTLLVKTDFKGGVDNTDDFKLNLFYTIDDDNNSVAGFNKSDIHFKGFDWLVNSDKDNQNKMVFNKDLSKVKINDIRINQNNEEMLLSGELRDSTYKDLRLNFTNVQLEKITPRIDSLALDGRVNGKLALLQNEGVYLPKSDIEIEDFTLNKFDLGDLKAIVQGDNSLTKYNVDIKLQNDDIKSLDVNGYVDVKKQNPNINIDVAFRDFLLDPLNPLGEGVISNIRGLVSGDAVVSGSLNKPSIDGELFLDKAGLSIPYLNVDYSFDFDSQVILKEQQFVFNNVAMTDSKYFSRGFLNGFIEHNNFSDWELGLKLNTDRLLVLNTEETEESLYYGTGFISGRAEISGPTDQLFIEVIEGKTEEGTVFNIPLNDLESFGDNSYIKFLSPEDRLAKANGEVLTQTTISGLQLKFELFVDQNAEIEIVIDKESGSTIKGKGEGNLEFLIDTNGKFDMWGDFSVFEGEYNFRYRGLAEKKFTVEPGGSIVWEGDPLNAELNIKALYNISTNPSVLLDTPTNRNIDVNLGIDLTGTLDNLTPDFTFDFPNVDSTIKSELEYRLSSKEERNNQALLLLVGGSFVNGVSDLNLNGTISERLSGIIGGLFGTQNDNFQVGVDLDLATNNPEFQTDNRFGLTLQTKLSEKILINGKVGVPFGSATQTVVAGDLQIELLLNDEGTLRATVFNRENSIRNFGEEIGYTQGIGLSYNVEFDTFKELLQIIFSGKNRKDKKKEEAKDDEFTEADKELPDFITIKKKDTKKKN